MRKQSFLQILSEYSDYGNSDTFAHIKNEDYLREPVNIKEFLENPYYTGGIGSSVFPKLKEELIDIFEKDYAEVILSGSIGWGKSFLARIIALYVLYRISCLRDPQKFLGLAPGEPIVFCVISVTGDKSNEFFNIVRNMIDMSPYFRENFPRLKRMDSTLIFPNNITFISAGSKETGINRIECNFWYYLRNEFYVKKYNF